MRKILSGAAVALAFAAAQPAMAQPVVTLKVVYIQCRPDPVAHPDGSQTSFFNNATYSSTTPVDAKVSGLAGASTTTAGKVTIAPGTAFTRGSATLKDQYGIAYPQDAKPQFEREFKASFRAPDGTGLKPPIVISYFSGGALIRQGKARVSAGGDFQFRDTIPDADFARLTGPVKVTVDAEGGAARLAEIEFTVPESRTKAVYESSFKPVTLEMIHAGTVPAGCRRDEASQQAKY